MLVMCLAETDVCVKEAALDSSSCHFASGISVYELAHILRDVDISSIVPDSCLLFTQKHNGCVSLWTRLDGEDKYSEVRLIDTSSDSYWPFIPEHRPEIVRNNKDMCQNWGLCNKSITSVRVRSGTADDDASIRIVREFVLAHIKHVCSCGMGVMSVRK